MALLQLIPVDEAALDQFCRQWKIAKLELFGSTLVDPSTARDVDLLVTFTVDAEWGLFEHVQIERELSALPGRKVHLITRRSVEASRNALRRSAILASARTAVPSAQAASSKANAPRLRRCRAAEIPASSVPPIPVTAMGITIRLSSCWKNST